MATEIERKFLVKSSAWREEVDHCRWMRQGYLTDFRQAERASVRIRWSDGQGELNIKSLELGVSRQEYAYSVPGEEAQEMLDTLCTGPLIEKRRHYIFRDGLTWEIDEFFGDNEGLVVAEVELQRADQKIPMPSWLGPEATHRERYYNVALARRPFREWNEQERAGRDLGVD